MRVPYLLLLLFCATPACGEDVPVAADPAQYVAPAREKPPLPEVEPAAVVEAEVAQVVADMEPPPEMADKDFLILHSGKDFDTATARAREAAQELGLKLDLRDLQPAEGGGLTFPSEICEAEGWSAPCYLARGRFDDGDWISVEYSNGYSTFSEGYFVVIASSGEHGAAGVQAALEKALTRYADAYVKTAPVYLGCVH